MIIDSHVLSLYCDDRLLPKVYQGEPIRKGQHFYAEFPVDYFGKNTTECRIVARKAGWKFFKDGRVLCPRCSGKEIQILSHVFEFSQARDSKS